MAADERFKDVDWSDVLNRLTLRTRYLFAVARAKGYAKALARAAVEPDELAREVILSVLEDKTVRYRPSRGASLVTFASHVLENDFKDLIRKGVRLQGRLVSISRTEQRDREGRLDPGVMTDVGDRRAGARRVELRAAAFAAARGESDLEEYVTAVFDCGAVTRRDQAELIGVRPSEITNRRKRLLKLLNHKSGQQTGDVGGSDEE